MASSARAVAADAFTVAVDLLRVSERHERTAEGFNAASREIDAVLAGLPSEMAGEVACALALLPRWASRPLLARSELDRLSAEIAWSWSDD